MQLSVHAKNHEIPWRKYPPKLSIRITVLSNKALLEIIQDIEVLVSKPLLLAQNTTPKPSLTHKGYKALIKFPHTHTQEQVYQMAFPNEKIALEAMNAIKPYFNCTANVPTNNAGIKRPRPQSQSQGQGLVRRVPPPPQYPTPQMYDFGRSDVGPSIHPYHPAQNTAIHQPYPVHSLNVGYPGLPTPSPSSGGVLVPPTMPVPYASPPSISTSHTSPPSVFIPQTSPTASAQNPPIRLPIPPTPSEPIRQPSPPPPEAEAEESLSNETQFHETQYSLPKGSSSSSCDRDKPPNAQLQKTSSILESDETLDDIPKTNSSMAIEGDLLSLNDDDDGDSSGLANHPALDPYEGTPWSRGQITQERDMARPNRYIDAGVYSMTDDQLYNLIGEIVIETGFQGMCERIWRVMNERFHNEGEGEDMLEDGY